MKRINIILSISLVFILILTNCSKEKTSMSDYRDNITGVYEGISVASRFISTWEHDTINITLILKKSLSDSIVDLTFFPDRPSENYSFYYTNNTLRSTLYYHPPSLYISNDTLFYHLQAGLGPIFEDCICKKKLISLHPKH